MIFNKLIQNVRRYRNKKLYLKIYLTYLNKPSCRFPQEQADQDFEGLINRGIVTPSIRPKNPCSDLHN